MAASFIRRRPFMFGCLTIVGFVFALVVAVVVQVFRVGAREPNIAVNYVEILNEPAKAVPEEERAWPLYERALALMTLDETAAYEAVGTRDYEELEKILEEQAAAMDLLQAAAARPHLGYILDETPVIDSQGRTVPPSLFYADLPQLRALRQAARLLHFEALAASRAGDSDRVVNAIEAMLGIADHSAQPQTTVSELVRIAIVRLTISTINEVLHRGRGLRRELRLGELDAMLMSLEGGERLRFETWGERLVFDDMLQRGYTDDGDGDGVLTSDGITNMAAGVGGPMGGPTSLDRVLLSLGALFASGRAETRERHAEVLDLADALAVKQPYEIDGDPYGDACDRLHEDVGIPPDLSLMTVGILAPALGKAVMVGTTTEAERQAARTAIALYRYRMNTGAFPASLNKLVPGLLEAVPLDPYDGQPLRYVLRRDGPLLYSIGVDRNDDDGRRTGRAAGWEPGTKAAAREASDPLNYDGDWVFFPPEDEDEQEDG